MAEAGNNLGIATVKVEILDSLPNVGAAAPTLNFEAGAYMWERYKKSSFFSPLLTEQVSDQESFAVCFPSKRKWYINNFLADGTAEEAYDDSSDESPRVSWTLIDPNTITTSNGVIERLLNPSNDTTNTEADAPDVDPDDPQELEGYPLYDVVEPDGEYPVDYIGPRWRDDLINKEAFPDDATEVAGFGERWGVEVPAIASLDDDDKKIQSVSYVSQNETRDGLLWGIESDAFLEENMPFFVTFKKSQPPTSKKFASSIIISLGVADEDNANRFDLYLALNKKPVLIDYLGTSNSAADVEEEWKEYSQESSRQLSYDENLEVGFMVAAGRLIVFVNGDQMVYTRLDRTEEDSGKLLECKINSGPIKVWGTNMQCRVNVSPMTFAPLSLIALPIPRILSSTEEGEEASSDTEYKGMDYEGEEADSVCHLPTPPSVSQQLYGCDCYNFWGSGGTATPEGDGFHKHGYIGLIKADEVNFESIASTDFFVLSMTPEDTEMDGKIIPRGGAPYFYRIKGTRKNEPDEEDASVDDVSDNVITVSETCSASDYYHITKNATVTLYNEDGEMSDLGLTEGNKGIRISWAWESDLDTGNVINYQPDYVKTFTGVVTSVSKNESPGNETITLNCEDYMYILQNTLMINSPFYDGMVAFYAVKNLAERAAMQSVTNEWSEDEDFFLPAGFAFTAPVMRFPARDSVKDCIINIVKRFQGVIGFNEEGELIVEKLPGGLFSEQSGTDFEYESDPLSDRPILNSRKVDYNYDSTINCVTILTVLRDNKNAVVYAKTATAEEDTLLFRKVALYDQPALGSLEAAKSYAADLALRVFKPILKTQVETMGGGTIGLYALDFVTVDGQEFRAMSIKRSFNADTNDYTESFDAEWLGG